MKKIGKMLFTFAFMVVSLFGMNSVNAQALDITYNNVSYEYYMTGGNGKIEMDIIKANNDVINAAISNFYPETSGASDVNVIPFTFTVKDGMTWDSSTDKATMYIRIPQVFNLEKSDKIYILKVNTADNSNVAFHSDNTGANHYDIKNLTDIQSVIDLNGVVSYEKIDATNYFTDKYAVLETGNFNSTGTTYYMLVTCHGVEPTPVPTPTPTPDPTTTTTIENPKTADAGNQLYILIGVVGLAGIIGLGVKFAKASK